MSRLQNLGVHVSMAKVGEPRENGYAEHLMRTIKEEHVALTEYRDFDEARGHLQTFIDRVYKTKRIPSSLGDLTPQEYAARWHNDQTRSKLTPTVAEERAPVGTDPSAATGPSPNGMAGRHADSPSVGPGPNSGGPKSDKSNRTKIKNFESKTVQLSGRSTHGPESHSSLMIWIGDQRSRMISADVGYLNPLPSSKSQSSP